MEHASFIPLVLSAQSSSVHFDRAPPLMDLVRAESHLINDYVFGFYLFVLVMVESQIIVYQFMLRSFSCEQKLHC